MTASVVSTLVSAGLTALFTALVSYGVVLLSVFLLQDYHQCYHEANNRIARNLDASHAPTLLPTQHNDGVHPTDSTFMIQGLHEGTQSNHQDVAEEEQQIDHNQEESRAPQDHGASDVPDQSTTEDVEKIPLADPIIVMNDPLEMHDLSECIRNNYQGGAEKKRQRKRRSKTGFLDLPGEIRNTIYELICDKSLGIFYGSIPPRTADGFSIAIIAGIPLLYICPMASTCRQIQEEYLSILSAQHHIGLSGLRTARTWRVIVHPEPADGGHWGRTKTWTIKHDITVPVEIPFKSRKNRGHPISVSPNRLRVKLECRYSEFRTWCTGPDVSMIFQLDCEHNIGLAQSSQDAIKALLSRSARELNGPSFTKFLQMADQVAGLDLKLGVVIPPKKTGLITPSPCSAFVVSVQFDADKPKVSVGKPATKLGEIMLKGDKKMTW